MQTNIVTITMTATIGPKTRPTKNAKTLFMSLSFSREAVSVPPASEDQTP